MDAEEGVAALLLMRASPTHPLVSYSVTDLILFSGGRKRRRSISPYERDRYEPRPRYGDEYGNELSTNRVEILNSPIRKQMHIHAATGILLLDEEINIRRELVILTVAVGMLRLQTHIRSTTLRL